MRRYEVAVFDTVDPHGKRMVNAYLRDYNPRWEGYCSHVEFALSGRSAKQLAIRNHNRQCTLGEERGE